MERHPRPGIGMTYMVTMLLGNGEDRLRRLRAGDPGDSLTGPRSPLETSIRTASSTLGRGDRRHVTFCWATVTERFLQRLRFDGWSRTHSDLPLDITQTAARSAVLNQFDDVVTILREWRWNVYRNRRRTRRRASLLMRSRRGLQRRWDF